MSIINWKVGDKVVVTENSLETMKNGNRSINVYPSDSYLKNIKRVFEKKEVGEVTNRFDPGYEMTVKFPSGSFHMKDNYVEKKPW